MNCNRLTKGIYYFENVLSGGMHKAIYDTITRLPFNLDSRPGSVEEVSTPSPILYGFFLGVREKLFEYIYRDDEDFRTHFAYDASTFKLFHYLAKGPQKEDYSHYHTDNDSATDMGILYYPHLDWKDSWGGALQIGSELEIYPKPNSAIVFPVSVPHNICPVDISTESWRLTVFACTQNSNNSFCSDFANKIHEGAFKEDLIQLTEIKLEQ